MAKFVTVDAKWLPPPKRGGSTRSTPMTANAVPAERGVSVILEGVNEYAHGLRADAREIMLDVGAKMHEDAVNSATGPGGKHVFTAKLRQSLGNRPQKDGDDGIKIVMGGPGAPYAPYFEYGTRSGAPTIEAIEAWMKRKKIAPLAAGKTKKDAYRASAVLIRKKIMRTGTPAHPSLFKAFEAHRQEFIDRMKALFGA